MARASHRSDAVMQAEIVVVLAVLGSIAGAFAWGWIAGGVVRRRRP